MQPVSGSRISKEMTVSTQSVAIGAGQSLRFAGEWSAECSIVNTITITTAPPSPPSLPPSPPSMLWRVSNAAATTWRPAVNLAFFSDVACTASIAIPADGGWPDDALACPSTGCALCSGWIGPVETRGCQLALDGDSSTHWRPDNANSGSEVYHPAGEIWMEIRFASDAGIACVATTGPDGGSNLGSGFGGKVNGVATSWDGGLTVETSVDAGFTWVTRERDEGAAEAHSLDANYFPLVSPVLINFQPESAVATVPTGWLKDTGAVYADRGNGQSYGWSCDLSADTRERRVSSDPLFDTFIIPDRSDICASTYWSIALAPGTYLVEIGFGDPRYDTPPLSSGLSLIHI